MPFLDKTWPGSTTDQKWKPFTTPGVVLGYFPDKFTPIETEQLKRSDLSTGNPRQWAIWEMAAELGTTK